MEGILDSAKYVLLVTGKMIFFALFSVIFLPAFFIVTYFQETWTKMLSELFKV